LSTEANDPIRERPRSRRPSAWLGAIAASVGYIAILLEPFAHDDQRRPAPPLKAFTR
jgi:hypothetical protein